MLLCSSLALISARATLNSLDVLSLLTASYLYALCQALDLRAMQHEFQLEVDDILREQLVHSFGPHLTEADLSTLFAIISRQIGRSLESTSTMDAAMRMRTVAAATTTPLVDFCGQRGTVGLQPGQLVVQPVEGFLGEPGRLVVCHERSCPPAGRPQC